MDSSTQPRFSGAAKTLFTLAFLLWAGAWMRLTYTHLTAPSPARYTEFYTADGPIDPPSWSHCHSVRLIVDAQVWQYCEETVAAPAGLIRFDLNTGRADLLWPVPDITMGVLLGAVPMPDGGLIVAARNDAPKTTLWHLRAAGGFEALGEVPYNLLALRIEGENLEAISAARPYEPTHHRRSLAGGPWISTPLPALPRLPQMLSDAYRFGAVDAASHGVEGWTLWGLRQASDGTTAELWKCPPNGAWALESLYPSGFAGGQLQASMRLDRSIDGVIPPFFQADEQQLLVRQDSNLWVPGELRPPGHARSFLGGHADLRFTAEGSESLGRWRGIGGEYTRVGGRWLGVITREDGIYAIDADLPERRHGPLGREGWLTSGATFIPRPGGYTVLGTFGTYVNLDENLERSDHLGLFARIGAHFAHFRRFASYNDTWRDLAALKMATLPIVLLGLPLFLLPGLIRRRRLSAKAAALWLVLALCFAWHFWYFTGPRWF